MYYFKLGGLTIFDSGLVVSQGGMSLNGFVIYFYILSV
jgi:hypothetical protein